MTSVSKHIVEPIDMHMTYDYSIHGILYYNTFIKFSRLEKSYDLLNSGFIANWIAQQISIGFQSD